MFAVTIFYYCTPTQAVDNQSRGQLLDNMSISRDCKRWHKLDHLPTLKELSKQREYGSYSFFKYSNSKNNFIFVFDDAPLDLMLLMNKKEQTNWDVSWVKLLDNIILDVSSNIISITPSRNNHKSLSTSNESAMGIIVLLGVNKESTIYLSRRDKDNVELTQIDNSQSEQTLLMCSHKNNCSFYQKGGIKLEDRKKIQAAKSDWKFIELIHSVEATCKFLNNDKNRISIKRYKEVNGACSGKVNSEVLNINYLESAKTCQVFLEKTIPIIYDYFESDNGTAR